MDDNAMFGTRGFSGNAVDAPCLAGDRSWSSAVDDVVRQLSSSSPRFVACAPALINLMGGLSELAGGSAAFAPLGSAVCAGAQVRSDGKVLVAVASPRVVLPADLGTRRSADCADATECDLSRAAETVMARLRATGLMREDSRGVSICIQPGEGLDARVGLKEATAAAVMVSASAALGAPLDAVSARDLLARGASGQGSARLDPAACLCALFAEADSVICAHGLTAQVDARVRLPKDVILLGIDSGITAKGKSQKLARAQAASFMGRCLTDRIMRHDAPKDRRWDGRLASVSAAEYVERLRDRIPTKLRGNEFLARFGPPSEEGIIIEPGEVYKVRSRTEHHIYEEVRTRLLMESLAAAGKPQQSESWLVEAGEALYASHWSYGQRCGLGSVETDVLVNLLREQGPHNGIYGAKVTGHGCGGLVVVLCRASETSQRAIASVLSEYHRSVGSVARILRGSTPGALVRGARPV